MTTRNRMSVLRMMGNMETAARDAAISDGEKVSVTKDGTIRDRAVSVTYTWSRRRDGAGLERWTWRLDGKRMNSDALAALLESLPVALATGAACKPGALIGRMILDACDSADAAMREARSNGAEFTKVCVRNGHAYTSEGTFGFSAMRARTTPVLLPTPAAGRPITDALIVARHVSH